MLDDVYPRVRRGPPRPSAVLAPQAFSLPPKTKRYMVRGRGAMLLPVAAGSRITVVSDEGGQPCEIVTAGSDGRIDVSSSGPQAMRTPPGSRRCRPRAIGRCVAFGGEPRRGASTSRRGGGPAPLRGRDAHGPEEGFTAQRDGMVIVAAPGGRMGFKSHRDPKKERPRS